MKIIHDIFYTDNLNKSQTLHLYLPECDEFKVFVYFHGGGLEAGDYSAAEKFAGFLTDNGIGVVSVDYRMYPYAQYPDFIRDCAAAVAWVFNHISEYGGCKEIYVGGSSAGGYISMMLCFDKRYLAPFKLMPTDIAGFIHDAGQPTTHFNVLRERGVDPRRCIVDDAAPLYYIGTENRYAPMHFIFSDNDMFARPEQTMLALKTMEHFEYDKTKYSYTLVENSEHCQYCHENDSEGINKLGKMIFEFINRR